MSLSSTRKMICNKIDSEFDTLLQPIQSAKGAIKTQINSVKSKLSSMTFSPAGDITSAISDLENNVNSVIPDVSTEDADELINFINSCDFLNENELYKNPIALLKTSSFSAMDQAFSFVFDLTELLPEFDAGQIVGNILDKFSGPIPGIPSLDISNIMRSADKIINCIAGRCGTDFSTRVTDMTTTLDGLYSDLNIVSNPVDPNWGKFDIDKIYDDVALSAQERFQMNNVVSSVESSKSSVTNAVGNAVNAIKGLL